MASEKVPLCDAYQKAPLRYKAIAYKYTVSSKNDFKNAQSDDDFVTATNDILNK